MRRMVMLSCLGHDAFERLRIHLSPSISIAHDIPWHLPRRGAVRAQARTESQAQRMLAVRIRKILALESSGGAKGQRRSGSSCRTCAASTSIRLTLSGRRKYASPRDLLPRCCPSVTWKRKSRIPPPEKMTPRPKVWREVPCTTPRWHCAGTPYPTSACATLGSL